MICVLIMRQVPRDLCALTNPHTTPMKQVMSSPFRDEEMGDFELFSDIPKLTQSRYVCL